MTMLVLAVLQAWANPIGETSARSIASNFMNSSTGLRPQIIPPSGYDMQLVYTEVSSVDGMYNDYYIFNTGHGFVIIAGDDRSLGVLAYGDDDIDMDNIPDAMQFMLDSYKEQIDYLLSNPGLVVRAPMMNVTTGLVAPVEPMLTCTWNQWAPYNDQAPSYDGKRCPTGCAATALSQVMYYWKHPVGEVPGVPGYTTATHKIELEDLPPTTFDWDNMKDSYKSGYTTEEGEAVAKLMRYVGQAEHMDYKPGGSAANVTLINRTAQLFGYSQHSQVIYKKNRYLTYSESEWNQMLQDEIDARRPVIYASRDSIKQATHAYVIDGFDGEKYHINWGWGGTGDGYYAFNAFNFSSYQFNSGHIMIAGLQPASPSIEVSEASLAFNAIVGETRQQTFVVTGDDLSGDLTLELDDESGCYSLDKTAVERDAAAAGDTITVTYSPSIEGESNASITISGDGAEAKTISLSGLATSPDASLSVSASVVSFGVTHINSSSGATRTITITGTNLTNNVQLSVTGDNTDQFTALTTVISPEQAAAGVTVTLRFTPTSKGIKQSKLEIKSDGVQAITVPLIGVGNKFNESTTGYLQSIPTNLSLVTEAGTAVTATFKVYYIPNGGEAIMIKSVDTNDTTGSSTGDGNTGIRLNRYTGSRQGVSSIERQIIISPDVLLPVKPYLTGANIVLAGDDCISITPERVSINQLKNGAEITVTYHPQQAGDHQAYIAISLPTPSIYTATPILVPIRGTATRPQIPMEPFNDNDEGEDAYIDEADTTAADLFDDSPQDVTGTTATGIDEMSAAVRIYAEGQDIIIETPVDQSAVISDIAGRARRVTLRAGRNTIGGNAGGVHIIRVGTQTAKLLLR